MPSSLQGKFVWYELTTPDSAAARRFFQAVLGWESRDGTVPGFDYSLMSAAGTDVAGIMGQTDDMPAGWLGYIGVDDIEAACAKAIAAGAAVCVPIHPIPGVGRFTILLDPAGSRFALLEYADHFPKPTVPTHGTHGNGWWRELHASDREKAFAFYSEQFGWVEAQAMDMGPMGIYQVVAPAAGEEGNGAMFNDRGRPPFWLFYFWVDDIDTAHDAVLANGGKVVNGPMEVPGGTWVFEGQDPQGLTFALVGYKTKK